MSYINYYMICAEVLDHKPTPEQMKSAVCVVRSIYMNGLHTTEVIKNRFGPRGMVEPAPPVPPKPAPPPIKCGDRFRWALGGIHEEILLAQTGPKQCKLISLVNGNRIDDHTVDVFSTLDVSPAEWNEICSGRPGDFTKIED